MTTIPVEQFQAASRLVEQWPAEIGMLRLHAENGFIPPVSNFVVRMRESVHEHECLEEIQDQIVLHSNGSVQAAGKTYSSFHAAAMGIATQIYMLIWSTVDTQGWLAALKGKQGQFDERGIKRYWTAVRHDILSFPSFDWSALAAGVVRERASFIAAQATLGDAVQPVVAVAEKAKPEWMTVPKIIEHYGLQAQAEAVRKRLERWRKDHDADFREVVNHRENEARFQYRTDAIRPLLSDLIDDQ